jgi:hypothetical protein
MSLLHHQAVVQAEKDRIDLINEHMQHQTDTSKNNVYVGE